MRFHDSGGHISRKSDHIIAFRFSAILLLQIRAAHESVFLAKNCDRLSSQVSRLYL